MTTTPVVSLAQILADDPKFHVLRGEAISGWRLDDDTLAFIDRHVKEGMATLETGSGISTVLFASKGAQHTVVVPDPEQPKRIAAYCDTRGISLARVRFVLERSETALPRLTGEYDLALIDGRHGFPTPFIDWFYASCLLRVGGVILIDDLHIWTCDLLKRYLLSEPGEWQVVFESTRMAIFEKRQPTAHERDWRFQPYVNQRSFSTSNRARVGQAAHYLSRGKLGLLPALAFPQLAPRLRAKLKRLGS